MLKTREEYFSILRQLAEGYPSQLSDYLANGGLDVCCQLHGPSVPASVPPGGCADVALGKHPAIQEFHKSGVVVCHAFTGQKVIDRRVAHYIYSADEEFFNQSWARTVGFRNKYMSGNFASYGMYGAGYCHLRLVETTIRSRLARIFGPVPFVADALRAYIHFGFVKGNRISIKKVADGYYHVVNSSVFRDADVIANELFDIVKKHPYARIGMDGFHADGYVRGQGQYYPVTGFTRDVLVRAGVYDEKRRGEISQWFNERGISLRTVALDQVVLATTAAAAVGGPDAGVLRDVVKVWAIVGDVEMKRVVSHLVASQLSGPGSYDYLMGSQTNLNLTSVFMRSGLRACASVVTLSETSKINATLLEAVIGVVALFEGSEAAFSLLVTLGLVSVRAGVPVVELNRVVDVGSDDVIRLNSREYQSYLRYRMSHEGY